MISGCFGHNITEVDTDPIHQPVQLGENRQSAWEEFEAFHWGRDGIWDPGTDVVSDWEEWETYKWETEDFWDNDINMEAVLGMGQALAPSLVYLGCA